MPKRKSESAPAADEGNSTKGPDPATGEKRKRGRPRKYPPGSRPQPVPGRGRGRPRKDPATKITTPAKPATPRPVGRPRKSLGTNGANASAQKPKKQKTEPVDAKSEEDEEEEDDDNDEDEEEADAESTGRSYWLMKAEPDSRMEKGVDVKFSIDDLRARTKPEPWDGVRNAVARNNMRQMKKGDLAFFYHSNCKTPGVAGMMEIVQEHSIDESAFDPKHPYYDAKSTRENPKWEVVHVEFRRKFDNFVPLTDLKAHSQPGKPLENLQVLKQSRLSVTRVSEKEWKFILGLAEANESESGSEETE